MKSSNWLDRVLQNREQRVQKQGQLISRYGLPLLSLTINIPGRVKDSDEAKYIYEIALDLIDSLGLQIAEKILTCKDTGYEALYALDVNAATLKKLTCKIEEEHPLGRFMDMDVIDTDRTILTRSTPRKCFVCEANAKECARAQKHSLVELTQYINKKVDAYKFSL